MPITVFLGGDAMTGRGIDQILPHPVEPSLFESWMRDARSYVALAEEVCGPVPRPVSFSYVWGDALAALTRHDVDARIVNLETSVTRSDERWRGKGIHYRMSPENIPCLSAAGIDVCSLANNHVMDWGRAGLSETLRVLSAARMQAAGAGETFEEAARPAVVPLAAGGRLVLVAVGTESSGVYPAWAAGPLRSGVWLVDEHRVADASVVAQRLLQACEPGDIAAVSIHWGSNWGYEVSVAQRRFAQRLIDEGVHLVHGHSSHHVRPAEVYRGRLILYGCGQLIDDYEGIAGHDDFRDDLVLLWFATLSTPEGALLKLRMTPMRIRRMRLQHADADETTFLQRVLNETSAQLGSRFEILPDGDLALSL